MAKQLILTGKVQGVMCRNYCSKYGRLLGLRGSATNLASGDVKVLLDTDDDSLSIKFIEHIKINPKNYIFWGKIKEVTISDYSGNLKGEYEF
ncbi:MAG: acylphosphatase [Desulfobacterales bacterium]|nr:acylphosphatase [Desulfobacterales bacterium]